MKFIGLSDTDAKYVLIKYISCLDGLKRLEGTLTELLIQKTLSQYLFEQPSFGWMRTVKEGHNQWYKFVEYPNQNTDTDLAVFKAFTFVTFNLISDVTIKLAEGIPIIDLKVYCRNFTASEFIFNEAKSKKLCEKINQRLKTMQTVMQKDMRFWLDSLQFNEVANIFMQRCLMNFGLDDERPVDIDAIDLKNEQLELVEFKRKDPASGYYKAIAPLKLLAYKPNFIKIAKLCIESKNRSDIENIIQKYIPFNRIERPCFGIDFHSHALAIHQCFSIKLKYRYIIWNRSSEENLENLLNANIKPVGDMCLCHKYVERIDLKGFTFTEKKDNGAIHNMYGDNVKPRFQIVLHASDFKELNSTLPSDF